MADKRKKTLEAKTKAKSGSVKKSGKSVTIQVPEVQKKKKRDWELKDFKAADYNPRTISTARLRGLKESMHTFGDLSGVVFNRRSNALVSGHQRLSTLTGGYTRVETAPYTDSHGTVEIGHILATTDRGVIKLPLRIVDWDDSQVERAANIAANAHGGEFNKEKLRSVLVGLEKSTFPVELLGLDTLTIMTLTIPQMEKTGEPSRTDSSVGSGFDEYGEESFSLQHTCPRCSFQFDDKKSKPSPGSGRVVAVQEKSTASPVKDKAKKEKKPSVDRKAKVK